MALAQTDLPRVVVNSNVDVIAADQPCHVDVTLSIKLPRNSGLGEPGAIIHVGEFDDDWLLKVPESSTQRDGMNAALTTVLEELADNVSAVGLVIGAKTAAIQTQHLVEAIEQMNAIELPLFIISCNSDVDHRLMSQLAHLSGGQFVLLRKAEDWDSRCDQLMLQASMGLTLNGFLRIAVPEQHKLDAVYQLTPQPALAFFRDAYGERSTMTLPVLTQSTHERRLSVGFRIEVSALNSGHFRIANIEYLNLDHEVIESRIADVVVEVSAEAHRQRGRNLRYSHWSHDVVCLAYLELMAQAYLQEDGGRIARLLEAFEEYSLVKDEAELASFFETYRCNFLHGGSFSVDDLNKIFFQVHETLRQR